VGTLQNLMGHWWQFGWLSLILLGMAAWRKKAPGVAGGAFALAAALRIFPAVLFLHPLLRWRSMPRRFWYGTVSVGFGALLIGAVTPLGWQGWSMFLRKMVSHANYIVFEPGNYGLRTVLFSALHWQDAVNNWHIFTQGEMMPFVLPSNEWTWIPVFFAAVLTILYASALPQNRFSVGLPLLLSALVVSPYYYLLFGLYFLEENRSRLIQSTLLVSLAFYVTQFALPPIWGYIVPQVILLGYVFWYLAVEQRGPDRFWDLSGPSKN
jgi:hypothetical protein